MSIGFTYRITRSRSSQDLVKVVDNLSNFLRIPNPNSSAGFYDWSGEINGGREHLVKLIDGNSIVYFSSKLNEVTAHKLLLENGIVATAPFHGSGDRYTVERREDDNSLTLLAEGMVTQYEAADENTYRLRFEILSASGIPREVFLLHQSNKILPDLSNAAGTPLPQRVLKEEELFSLPNDSQYMLDTKKAGIQKYRSAVYSRGFATEEAALATEASLLGQIVQLISSLLSPEEFKREFAVIPGSGTIQIGQQIQFDSIAEQGDVSWLIIQNSSGAVITSKGLYTAGSAIGVDTVSAMDGAGNSLTVTLTVEDSYSSVFDGSFNFSKT